MESGHQRLGPQAMVDDLEYIDTEDMPQYDLCVDGSQNRETFPSFEEEKR